MLTLAMNPGRALGTASELRRPFAPALLASGLLHIALAALVALALRPGIMPQAGATNAALMVQLVRGPTDRDGKLAAMQPGSTEVSPARALARPAPSPARAPQPDASLDSRYVPARELDIGPVPFGEPNFAPAMNRHVLAGTVVLRVYVSTFGRPDRVDVLGTPVDADFAQDLRRALAQTSFLPGRRNHREMPSFVDYEFNVELLVSPSPSRGQS